MAKGVGMNAVEFVKVFGPMAKQGKSAAEIGAALGMKPLTVSAKASQLRKLLAKSAQAKAKEQGLSDEDTAKLVKAMADKLPRIKGSGRRGRKAADANEIVQALDAVLSALDAPVDPVDPPVDMEDKPRRRGKLFG